MQLGAKQGIARAYTKKNASQPPPDAVALTNQCDNGKLPDGRAFDIFACTVETERRLVVFLVRGWDASAGEVLPKESEAATSVRKRMGPARLKAFVPSLSIRTFRGFGGVAALCSIGLALPTKLLRRFGCSGVASAAAALFFLVRVGEDSRRRLTPAQVDTGQDVSCTFLPRPSIPLGRSAIPLV